MSYWTRKYSNGSYYTAWNCRLQYDLNSQGANSSHISLYLATYSDSSGYTQWGLWDGRIYVNGAQVARGTPNRTIANSAVQLTSWSGDIAHDANGNKTITIGDYINAPANECTQANISWALPRIALAPTGLTQTLTETKTNQFSVSLDISSMGHGTSAAHDLQYKLSTSGTWLDTADQACTDLAPNTFTVTGLLPNKTYNYRQRVWNNNGDYAYGATASVTTKAGIKMILPNGTVQDRIVKKIDPSGTVTTRVVTKIL